MSQLLGFELTLKAYRNCHYYGHIMVSPSHPTILLLAAGRGPQRAICSDHMHTRRLRIQLASLDVRVLRVGASLGSHGGHAPHRRTTIIQTTASPCVHPHLTLSLVLYAWMRALLRCRVQLGAVMLLNGLGRLFPGPRPKSASTSATTSSQARIAKRAVAKHAQYSAAGDSSSSSGSEESPKDN